jgi:hypothetical protein
VDTESIAAQTASVEEFQGVYVAHWEAARYVVQVGRGLLGRPKTEKWQALLPSGFQLPHVETLDRRSPAKTYRMRVRGRLGPPGHFGHMGICTRQLDVVEVLSCEETSSPGRTW